MLIKLAKKFFHSFCMQWKNKMANFQSIKNICKKLGENNKPTYEIIKLTELNSKHSRY